jgi:hypothetical protein
MKSTCVLAFALAIPSALGVTAQQRDYVNYGRGAKSCGLWLQDKQSDSPDGLSDYDIDKTWVLGFVSGYGYKTGSGLRETDSGGIFTFMDSYCQAHPLDAIYTGVQALVQELKTP